MAKQKGSRTLILVCRQTFSRIVEHLLRSEGFTNSQRGTHALAERLAIKTQEGNSEVFVVKTDINSAMRLTGLLRACPIKGGTAGLFEFYVIGN